MRTTLCALAFAFASLTPLALAQAPQEDKMLAEVEASLNQVLVLDESGKVLFKREVRDAMPEGVRGRVEAMIGSLVQMGDDGRFRFKNPERVRAYLPMIKGFLKQNGLESLSDLEKMTPEERAKALRGLMRRPGGDQPQERAVPSPRGHGQAPPRGHGQAVPPAPDGASGVEQRLARMEERLARIEAMLDRALHENEQARRPERARDGLLGRFRNRGLGRRAEVWAKGLSKLNEIMKPADRERFQRALSQLQPGDLQDRQKLMEKLQDSVDPEDRARLLGVFSEFMGTEEGREFFSEAERSMKQWQTFSESPRWERLQGRLQRLQEGFQGLLQGDLGNDELRERVAELFGEPEGGRPRGPRARRHAEPPQHRQRHHDGEEEGAKPRPPTGSKLY